MQAGRDQPGAHAEGGLDQGTDPGGGVEMPRIRLERAQRARVAARRVAAEGLGQRIELDRVAERRGGAVRLHHADAIRGDAGQRHRLLDHRPLSGKRGRGEAGLVGAVIVDRRSADDRENAVAVFQRPAQRLQQHDADAIADEGAGGFRVERAAGSVGREDHARLVEIAGGHREGERRPACERQIAFAAAQLLAGDMDGDQRAGTRRLDRHRRPRQTQLVGRAGRQIVLVVADQPLEGPRLAGRQHVLRLRHHESAHARGPEDPDAHAGDRLRKPRHVQRLARAGEKQALLRIDGRGLRRRVAEQPGIEMLGFVDDAGDGDEVVPFQQRGIETGGGEILRGDPARQFLAVGKPPPEGEGIRRSHEAASRPDDRDRFHVLIDLGEKAHVESAHGSA